VSAIFQDWLERNEPGKKAKILDRIRSMRGGKLNDPRFGERMRGHGVFADQIRQMFEVARRKAGLSEDAPALSTAAFRRPPGNQLELELPK
jgi:DNA repair photolyase